jgi:hypothetical protein
VAAFGGADCGTSLHFGKLSATQQAQFEITDCRLRHFTSASSVQRDKLSVKLQIEDYRLQIADYSA